MTLEEINKFECTRGWPLSVRRLLSLYLDELQINGIAMIPNKGNLVSFFEQLCYDMQIDVEAYISPYKSVNKAGQVKTYLYAYYLASGKDKAFKEKIIKMMGLEKK